MYFQIVSLEDLVLNKPREDVYKALRTFSCTINKEIEAFLLERAIFFELEHRSRTFLLLSDNKVEGFFSLSLNILSTEGLSNNRAKQLSPKHSKDERNIPCFLIGQLARSDSSILTGKSILDTSLFVLKQARKLLGTKFVMLDSVNEPKVLDFYKENGFTPLNTDKNSISVKMIRWFD